VGRREPPRFLNKEGLFLILSCVSRLSVPKGRGQPFLIKGGRLGGLRFLAIGLNILRIKEVLRSVAEQNLEKIRAKHFSFYPVLSDLTTEGRKAQRGLRSVSDEEVIVSGIKSSEQSEQSRNNN